MEGAVTPTKRNGVLIGLGIAAAVSVAVYGEHQSTGASATRSLSSADVTGAVRPSSILEIIKMTTPEYFALAQTVVVAKSVDSRTSYGPGGNIFTFFGFDTERLIKGSVPSHFELRFLGGTIGDTTIPLPIDGRFEPGIDYILLLGAPNAEGYFVLNPAAVFVVRTERESKRRAVVPCGDRLPLYDHSTGRRLVGSSDWCFLDDFIYSLNKTR